MKKLVFYLPVSIFFALILLSGRAFADLPDLRGKTLFVTGTFRASGTALGENIAEYFPDGIELTASNPAKMVIAQSGLEDNSTLTALFPLPPNTTVVNNVTYAGCTNPSLPLTGRFNRATGAFHMTGAIAGTSVFDFGVYDASIFGIKRVLVGVKNLRVTLDGTGSIGTNGQFTIKQPGDMPFLFDISSNFFTGTPKLGLQTPSSCGFGGTTSTIKDPSLTLSNWTMAPPSLSGRVTLEACAMPAQPVTFILHHSSGSDLTKTVTLGANGEFSLYDLSAADYTVFVKGRKWLQTSTPASLLNSSIGDFSTLLLAGDINDDNAIDFGDLSILLQSYNALIGDDLYREQADINCDGGIDFGDLSIMLQHYNLFGD